MFPSSRKGEFKQGIDMTRCSTRRNETSISVRKAKKEEGLNKRRASSGSARQASPVSVVQNFSDLDRLEATSIRELYAQMTSNDARKRLHGTKDLRNRLMSSRNIGQVTADVVTSGVIPLLVRMKETLFPKKKGHSCSRSTSPLTHLSLYQVEFLGSSDIELQKEAFYALTPLGAWFECFVLCANNVGSCTRLLVNAFKTGISVTHQVIEAGALSQLVRLLQSDNMDSRDQSAYCLVRGF
jgi:hypothetical protein